MDAPGCLGWSPPALSSLPPCPFLAPSYELALQSICSPVSISIQQRQEELPVSSICPSLPGLSLVSGSSVPPPASHWSAAALPLPRPLIGQRQLRRLPLAEPPCAGAAVGSRQCQARLSSAKRRSGSPGRPAGERGVSRSCPGSSEPEAAAQRERVLRTAPPEVCGRTGAGEGEEPCAAPQAHCPPLPRGPPVGWGCGSG